MVVECDSTTINLKGTHIMKSKTTEILAPVGNKEMLIAAVRSGADAVYLGAKDFSARRNAENFDLTELENAIKYCHKRGVAVYLTLNILIKESELDSAFSLAKSAYNLGIDGIIIQDLGLARVLHEKIPELKLHASTQMSVHTPAALPILKDLGFCRVVVAREMSREELKAFCAEAKKLDIEVEVFVHGALCMCVSGQCLMSAFLGSRSGNRGLCAGPCRLPFKVSGGTGYDLSLKDLSLTEHIAELHKMGVTSFKIEGRMKRPEYVAAATAACKQALLYGSVDTELESTLKNVFSRSGFTDGYYTNKLGKDMFGIRTKEDVVAASKAFPRLHELYRNEYQSIDIFISAEIVSGRATSLTLTDCDGNTVTAFGEEPQSAQNKPLTAEKALQSLCKFGATPYKVSNSEINLQDGLFVPAGELNDLRRRACELLDEKREQKSVTPTVATYHSPERPLSHKGEPKIIIRLENADQLPEDLSGVAAVVLALEEKPEEISKIKIPLIADIPRGILNEDVILKKLELFKENGCKAALCGNLSAVTLCKKAGLMPIADTGLNLANSESLATAHGLGVCAALISAEQPIEEVKAISAVMPRGIVAYGNIPLMLFKNCPIKNGKACKNCDKNGVITDRLGVEFPVRCRMGYSELLNSLPIWLADRKSELAGIDFCLLYFTREDSRRVSEVLYAYKNGLSPDTKHTRGLYYRGTV